MPISCTLYTSDMDRQESGQKKEPKEPTHSKPPHSNKPPSEPKATSPMGKFNDALRKLLSVSKKNLKDK